MKRSVVMVALLGATVAILLGGAQSCKDDRGGTQPPPPKKPAASVAAALDDLIIRTETFDNTGRQSARIIQLVITCFQADGRIVTHLDKSGTAQRSPIITNERTPNAYHAVLTPGVVTCSASATLLGKRNESVMMWFIFRGREVPHSRTRGRITTVGANGNGAAHVSQFFNVPA